MDSASVVKLRSKFFCGLETFMKFPKGSFTASSLKWPPNQKKTGEKFGLPDAGGCGPYIYALMKYILTNRQLLKKGLKESFTKRRKRAYLNEIHFHSRNTRKEIQSRLWAIRQQRENANLELDPSNIYPWELPKHMKNVRNEKPKDGVPEGEAIPREGNLLAVLSPEALEAVWGGSFFHSSLQQI